MPSDKKTKSDQMREDLQKIIDMIPENKEDSISIRNMLRDTLTGAADMLFYFRRAIETGESPTPEQMMQTTLDFAPVPAGVAAKMTPKNAVGILGSKFMGMDQERNLRLNKMLSERIKDAEKMKAEGATTREIWQKLRLNQDPRGNWRFEIPDTDAKVDWEKLLQLTDKSKRAPSITSFIDHPELFENTQAQWFKARADDTMSPETGSYNPSIQEIRLSWDDVNTVVQAKKQLEAQRKLVEWNREQYGPDDLKTQLQERQLNKIEGVYKLYDQKLRNIFFHEVQHGQQFEETISTHDIGKGYVTTDKGTGSNMDVAAKTYKEKIIPLQSLWKKGEPIPTELQPYLPLMKFLRQEIRKANEDWLERRQNPEVMAAAEQQAQKAGKTVEQMRQAELYRKGVWLTYASEAGEVEARIVGNSANEPDDWLRKVPPSERSHPELLEKISDDVDKELPWPEDVQIKELSFD